MPTGTLFDFISHICENKYIQHMFNILSSANGVYYSVFTRTLFC